MHRRIRVLFIVNSLHFGGAEKHVVTLLNHLDVDRFSLSLAYLKDDAALLPQLDGKRLDGGAFCCHVSTKIDFTAVRKLSEHIRDHGIDILVCTNTYSLLYGWVARHLSGHRPKLIEVFHTTELVTTKDKLQMLLYRPLMRASELLIYVCENQRSYWRENGLGAARDAVIHNGIDLAHFSHCYSREEKTVMRARFGLADEDYVVGLCAAMRPEKAHGDLLEAIARLKTIGLRVTGLLIGDGPERQRIEKRIVALGLVDQVRITGYMNDVRPAITACDVMSLVSHSETFSIAALEAMALGKPMVMTATGGASEQIRVEEEGFLFAPADIDALSNCLARLADKCVSETMGARARQRVESVFSLASMVGAYERIFTDMAAS